MYTEIKIDSLTNKGVTIKTQRYIVENDERLNVGEVHAKAYVNSERGRAELYEEVADPYLAAVLAVWGDAPTVVEKIIEQPAAETI